MIHVTTLPFDRISRTDSRGQFTIRGIAPGSYRIYALMDGNQNYLFDSKTEVIAFQDSVIVPSMEGAAPARIHYGMRKIQQKLIQ